MYVGDIVYLKNIVFEKKYVDHSFNIGRPCIFIGEMNDKMYFASLSNIDSIKHKISSVIYPDRENKLKKPCHPNFKHIVEKPISFYESDSHLSREDTARLFKNILRYIKEYRRDSDEIYVTLAKEYLDSIEKAKKGKHK